MSITTSNCEQICHSHTNTSNSKMLYSFSKQPRFLKRKKVLYLYIQLDVTASTISKTRLVRGQQDLATGTSTILPGISPALPRPTHTPCTIRLLTALPLDSVGKL